MPKSLRKWISKSVTVPTKEDLYMVDFPYGLPEGDWRKSVPYPIRNFWRTLTDEARLAVYLMLH